MKKSRQKRAARGAEQGLDVIVADLFAAQLSITAAVVKMLEGHVPGITRDVVDYLNGLLAGGAADSPAKAEYFRSMIDFLEDRRGDNVCKGYDFLDP